MVHRRRLHGTRQSTPLTGTCLTGTRLKTGIQPCCSGLQVQGTAISPSGATAYSIRSFVRFCKCKECKFVNLSQIGAGFRRKREPRGAGGGENWCRRYALKRGFGGRVPRRGSGAEPLQMGRVPRWGSGAEPLQMGRVPLIEPQGRRPFNASLRLSAPYYSAAYPRTRIARRISHKIIGRGVDYDSPADYLRNGEALGVYRAESKSVV